MAAETEGPTDEATPDGAVARGVSAVRNHLALSGVIGVAVVGVLAWLAFGIFGVHTLFIDDEVDEANPFADALVDTGDATDDASAADAADDPATDDPADAESTGTDTDDSATTDDTTPADSTTTTEAPAPTISTEASGSFISLDHPTRGEASVITNGEQRFLRFENFETDNGPDLNVYLATGDPDGDLGDFIDLGTLKGNIGDQNYELDLDIDLTEYDSVFVWCVRFGVGFGAAGLA